MIEAKVIKDSISDHGVRLLTEREIALEQGYKRYLGKICKKHNKRERWVCNNICVKCSREYAHKYMPSYIKRNQDRLQARRKRWTLDNP